MYKNEWSNDTMVKALNYESVNPINSKFIDGMINYLNNLKLETINICDIGCGNGRIVLDLKTKLTKPFNYVGIDCNEKLIKIAKEKVRFDNVNFICNDADNLDESFFTQYKNYIFLFESTICMVKYPDRILKILKEISDHIILTRIHITLDKYLYDKKNKWVGMNNESNNWYFSIKFLKDVTNMNIKKDCLIHKTSDEEYANIYLFK